jgi:hypothetical protein
LAEAPAHGRSDCFDSRISRSCRLQHHACSDNQFAADIVTDVEHFDHGDFAVYENDRSLGEPGASAGTTL